MAETPTLPGTTDRRIASLLTLLAENATIVISGGEDRERDWCVAVDGVAVGATIE